MEDAGMESAYTGGAGAVEHSRINSESFSISEMELFDLGWWLSINILSLKYGFTNLLLKLETKLGAG